jgi:dTMP kinase
MVGRFISLDGVDGGGKSTQVQLLAEHLRRSGQTVSTFRDPGGTALGEALREILLHRSEIPLANTAEMLLYMASRAQLVSEFIQPTLALGHTVITDRFLLANVVYQGCAGGLSPEHIWSVGHIATAGILPDLTIILDIDIRAALMRIDRGLDRLESRGLDYLDQVRTGFLQQAQHLGDRALVIDANASIDAVHAKIVAAVDLSTS